MEEKQTFAGLFCFGGSFNPIHNGHLRCIRDIAASLPLKQALLIPSAMPPHKSRHNVIASATDRLALCRIAAAGDPVLRVSDIELRREGPSYTYDTVLELKAAHRCNVCWLIGADMLMSLPEWHRARELIDAATIVVMRRPGVELEWDKLPPEFRKLQANVVDAPLVDISATEIRRRVWMNEPIDELVPEAVADYIMEKGLYR